MSTTAIVQKVGEFKPTKRFKDLTGFRHEYLEVLALEGRNKYHQGVYSCKCHACGKEGFLVAVGEIKRNKSCGCSRYNTNKLSTHPHHLIGKKSAYWTGHGDISGYRWRKIQDTAAKRNIKVEVTIEDIWDLFLQQDRRCALSGQQLEFGIRSREHGNASLDRIDSSKGYTKDNIQWIHKKINTMKMDLDQSDFLSLCKLITENQK